MMTVNLWQDSQRLSRLSLLVVACGIVLAEALNWYTIKVYGDRADQRSEAQNQAYVHLVRQNEEMVRMMHEVQSQSWFMGFYVQGKLDDFNRDAKSRLQRTADYAKTAEDTADRIDGRLNAFSDQMTKMLKDTVTAAKESVAASRQARGAAESTHKKVQNKIIVAPAEIKKVKGYKLW